MSESFLFLREVMLLATAARGIVKASPKGIDGVREVSICRLLRLNRSGFF
jgi:hypothetical protein